MYLFLSVLAVVVPLMLLVFGYMYSRKTKPLLQKLLPGIIAYLLVLTGSFLLQLYFRTAYDFPMLPSYHETKVAIIILAILVVIFVFVLLLANYIGRRLPKSQHNPVVGAIVLFGLLVQIGLIIFWFYPFGMKWEYANILDRAEEAFSQQHIKNAEITVELLSSIRFCGKRCDSSDHYHNLFMMKNHLARPVQAQVQILAKNEKNEQLEIYESEITPLQPGEYRIVVTDETNLASSVWNRWTSETEEQVTQFEYKYRY